MIVRLRGCRDADSDHVRSRRQYAHTGHYKDTICLASTFLSLPLSHQAGLFAHEIGHIIMMKRRKDHNEPDADKAAERFLGVTIRYATTTPWGEDLQYLNREDTKKLFRAILPLPRG